jgi:hypothetical protein
MTNRIIQNVVYLVLTMFLLFTSSLQAQDYNLSFDGNDDVNLGQPATLDFDPDADAISISLLFRVGSSNSGMFISKAYGAGSTHHQFAMGYSGNDLVFAEIGGVRIDDGSTIAASKNDGNWHHACVTSNGSTFILYVDGINVANGSCGSVEESVDWLIGARRDANNTGFGFQLTGDVDEVRIWDKQLSQAEVRTDMFNELSSPSSVSNLLAYYSMSDGSGSTLSDDDGSLDGTITGASWDDPSTSPIADDYIFSLGNANISETVDVSVDVSMTGVTSVYSYAALQINSAPNSSTGLLAQIPTTYWELWPSNEDFDNSYSATVSFHYDNITVIGDESELKLYRRDHDGATTWTEVSSYTIVDGGDNTDGVGYITTTITQATPGGFTGQYIITSDDSDDNNLPIDLMSFDAQRKQNYVLLNWATNTETNNNYFILRKSTDGTNFTTLATIQGAGNSNTIQQYSHQDYENLRGDVYYQLIQVDFDGTETYIPVIFLQDNSSTDKIYAVFHQNSIEVKGVDNFKYTILDMQGRIIQSGQSSNPSIDFEQLNRGIYILQVESNKLSKQFKFLR